MKGAKILAILVVAVMSVSLLATVVKPDKVGKPFEAVWDALVDLQEQIVQEIADRIAGDDAEATARADADAQLQSNIDAEEAARIAANDALQNLLEAAIASGDTATADAAQAANDALQNLLEAAIASGDTDTADAAQAANDALQSALEAAIASGDTDTADAAQAANDALQNLLEAAIAAEEAARIADVDAEETARMVADDALQGKIDAIQPIPAGVIVMWSGSIGDIPDGWALCDGTGGTPDLQNRFIVGAGDSYAVDAMGGENTHTLSVSEMPGHRHSYSGNTYHAGYHSHGLEDISFLNDDYDGHWGDHDGHHHFATPKDIRIQPAGNHQHGYSGNTNYQGGNAAHENRPPYYALAYIMKVE